MTPAAVIAGLRAGDQRAVARAVSWIEDEDPRAEEVLTALDRERVAAALVVGLTGPPGAGKSTLTNALVRAWRRCDRRVGVIAVDPSSAITGGAVLGDRIRMMEHALDDGVVVRSMASRGRLGGLASATAAVARLLAAAGCSPVIIETVGVGQLEIDIAALADVTVLVLAPGLGDEVQAMKAGVLEVADLVVVNKADLAGADALFANLETVLPDRRSLLTTVATDATGVDALRRAVEERDRERRASGEHHERRRRAALVEAVERTLALLRPRVTELAADLLGEDGDPHHVARRLVERYSLKDGPGPDS